MWYILVLEGFSLMTSYNSVEMKEAGTMKPEIATVELGYYADDARLSTRASARAKSRGTVNDRGGAEREREREPVPVPEQNKNESAGTQE